MRKKRKVRRMRGSHTHGYGAKKKHRGSGSRGGKGRSGKFDQKKTWFLRYEPEVYGKVGFKSIGRKKARTINLRDMEKLSEKWIKEGKASVESGAVKINLGIMDYSKLLGTGKITKKFIVEVESFSKSAKEKIEQAGGKIIAKGEEEEKKVE